jgi:hypothetical protein
MTVSYEGYKHEREGKVGLMVESKIPLTSVIISDMGSQGKVVTEYRYIAGGGGGEHLRNQHNSSDSHLTRQLGYKHTFCRNLVSTKNCLSLLGAFVKSRKATVSFVVSFCPSVCPHGTTRLTLDRFWWNFVFECFSKICRENSSLVKIRLKWQVLYMKTFSLL